VAAVAWSLTVDTNQVDPHNIHDAWNWRATMPTLDTEKLLEFRRWWLKDALPEAWKLAEAQTTEQHCE
jgi:hypothetical protein